MFGVFGHLVVNLSFLRFFLSFTKMSIKNKLNLVRQLALVVFGMILDRKTPREEKSNFNHFKLVFVPEIEKTIKFFKGISRSQLV